MKQQTLLSGDIKKQLILLAVPLLLGNILQQLYNTADSLIVGYFLGTDAFASVGISGSIMNLFIFILNGFCVGLSVIFAQLYGTGDRQQFRREVFVAVGLGILLTFLSGGQAMSVLISQNQGAGNKDRVMGGFKNGLLLNIWLGITLSLLMFFGAAPGIRLFLGSSDTLALSYGVGYLKVISFFYLLCFIGCAFVGYFRGTGRVHIPFWGTTLHISLRVILSYLLVSRLGLPAIAVATGCGWILVVSFQLIMYRYYKRRQDA